MTVTIDEGALAKAAEDWHDGGVGAVRATDVGLADLLPASEAVAEAIRRHGTPRDRWVGGREAGPGELRRFRDWVLDWRGVQERLPRLHEIGPALLDLACLVSGQELVTSPHPLSGITAKLYDGPGSQHGWHVETNSVTAVLLFSDGGNAFEWAPYGRVNPARLCLGGERGSIRIVRGLDLWHRVKPALEAGDRTCAVYNFYTEAAALEARPAGLDVQHYG